jgi:hypothetical protein
VALSIPPLEKQVNVEPAHWKLQNNAGPVRRHLLSIIGVEFRQNSKKGNTCSHNKGKFCQRHSPLATWDNVECSHNGPGKIQKEPDEERPNLKRVDVVTKA